METFELTFIQIFCIFITVVFATFIGGILTLQFNARYLNPNEHPNTRSRKSNEIVKKSTENINDKYTHGFTPQNRSKSYPQSPYHFQQQPSHITHINNHNNQYGYKYQQSQLQHPHTSYNRWSHNANQQTPSQSVPPQLPSNSTLNGYPYPPHLSQLPTQQHPQQSGLAYAPLISHNQPILPNISNIPPAPPAPYAIPIDSGNNSTKPNNKYTVSPDTAKLRSFRDLLEPNQQPDKGNINDITPRSANPMYRSVHASAFSTINASASSAMCTVPIGFGCDSNYRTVYKDTQSKLRSRSYRSNKQGNTIGLSIGGAKDVGNFRECIKQNIQPKLGSVSYSGLLYEYKFDTTTVGHLTDVDDNKKDIDNDDGSALFYPTYCYAKIKKKDFISDQSTTIVDDDDDEYYMTLGLNSNINADDFARKHLNLIIILDKSGSMSDTFKFGDNKTKMMIANESVVVLLKHLTDKDTFGIVTFDDTSHVLQPLISVNDIDMNELTKQIMKIHPGGGTNFESGYNKTIEMYKNIKYNVEYENRIILLTDAQPNIGLTDPDSLLNLIKTNAMDPKKRIYTTIIGVGLDFNGELVNKITSTRGCNYFTVNSQTEFQNKMDKEFDYMVTPLVFNVVLKLISEGNSCKIDKVYGSNNENYSQNILKNGEITKIDTLFPSKRDNSTGEVQGGILLIKLKKTNNNQININVSIQVTFEDRNNIKYKNKQSVSFKNHQIQLINNVNDMIESDDDDDNDNDNNINNGNYYDNIGIRKGILLCKYVEILIEWIKSEQNIMKNNNKLQLSPKYKTIFINFQKHFQTEMKICKDKKLKREIDILNKLITINTSNTNNNNDNNSNQMGTPIAANIKSTKSTGDLSNK